MYRILVLIRICVDISIYCVSHSHSLTLCLNTQGDKGFSPLVNRKKGFHRIAPYLLELRSRMYMHSRWYQLWLKNNPENL